MTPADPVVAWRGSSDPAASLVVLLHGRGSNEQDGLTLADGLPEGPAYAALRAPIPFEDGFIWFERTAPAQPEPASLRASLDWFSAWLDDVAPEDRPVMVIGFSMGAVFAAALALDDPSRFTGVAVLYGTVPFDAGLPDEADRLGGLTLFHAQAREDFTFPEEMKERTWEYLSRDAGANAVVHRHAGGHAIAPEVATSLRYWVGHNLPGAAAT